MVEPLNKSRSFWIHEDGSLNKERLVTEVKSFSNNLASSIQLLEASQRFYDFIMFIWSLDTSCAMDAAELVCNTVRETGGLDLMLCLLSNEDASIQLLVSKGLEQIMTATNRRFIVNHKQFNTLIKVAGIHECSESLLCGIGILENLFKDSGETCLTLIQCGALDSILQGCRCSNPKVLHHCAAALNNCAMYGGLRCQMKMMAKHADHWLFPLAFSNDNVAKYYALLTISFLASNAQLKGDVARSGTIDLVLPFLLSQDPEEFAKTCHNHAHGRSGSWLKQLVPLLVCGNEQARSLSAFHFAMEAAIKKKQGRLKILTDIDAISHLQKSAKIGSELTAQLCCQALLTCGEVIPVYQCWNALSWTPTHVSAWVTDLGLTELAPAFIENMVTGTLLVDLTIEDLKELGFSSRLKSRWFLEQICDLRCLIDVSNKDHDSVCKWLKETDQGLAVYQVDFIRKGVSKTLLPHLTDDLLEDIGVSRPLDRLKLLLALKALPKAERNSPELTNHPQLPSVKHKHYYDVFISYRRSNGSQLASLLKVHLQVKHGLSVFIDVDELASGKFDEAILDTIGRCRNFLMVLSPDALNRCKGDTAMQDWVHRELVCAIEKSVGVVPVLDPQFRWPTNSELPEDLQHIHLLNGISWSHEYQDACIEKLIRFLQL